jgi:hypothetical protein
MAMKKLMNISEELQGLLTSLTAILNKVGTKFEIDANESMDLVRSLLGF